MHNSVVVSRALSTIAVMMIIGVVGWVPNAVAESGAGSNRGSPVDVLVEPERADPEGRPEPTTLRFAFEGVDHEILLVPHSRRDASFQVLSVGPGGVKVIPAPPPRTVAGTVRTLDGSPSALTQGPVVQGGWSDRGLHLLLITAETDDRPRQAWTIEPAESPSSGEPGDAGAAGMAHVLRSVDDVAFPQGFCEVLGASVKPTDPAGAADDNDETGVLCTPFVELAIDTDHEMFLASGGTIPALVADVEALLAGVSALYAEQVDLGFLFTAIVMRPEEPDPYVATDLDGMLAEVKAEWTTVLAAVPRDLVHLLTGKDIDGTTIGGAWNSGACVPGLQFGVAQSWWNPGFAERVLVTTHEIGHGFSAFHCIGVPTCGIMCGIPGGCNGSITEFGTFSAGQIVNYLNAHRACFEPPTLGPASASDGEVCGAVRIDFTPVAGALTHRLHRGEMGGGDTVRAEVMAIDIESPYYDTTAEPGVRYLYGVSVVLADGCEPDGLPPLDQGHTVVASVAAADFNNDCMIDAADLALLLSEWGRATPRDLDGSGVVDGGDLAMLLAAWSMFD